MKVLCIDDKIRHPHGFMEEGGIKIKEGEVYEVLRETEGYDKLGNTYRVYELTVDPGYGYELWRFVPISNIDETEFERNYNKETV